MTEGDRMLYHIATIHLADGRSITPVATRDISSYKDDKKSI